MDPSAQIEHLLSFSMKGIASYVRQSVGEGGKLHPAQRRFQRARRRSATQRLVGNESLWLKCAKEYPASYSTQTVAEVGNKHATR